MANTLDALTVVQVAMESTAGTDLATTSKLVVERFEATPEDEVYRPQHKAGLLVANKGNEQVMTRGSRLTVGGKLCYEQAQHWLEGAIAGAITPTGTNPYTWTFTRNATAVPTLDTYTFERRISDGSNVIGNAWHYGVIDSLTLRGSPRQMIEYEAQLFARRIQTETLTAGQSLPSTITFMPHGTSALYIDSTFANRGTTLVSSQLLDWSLTIRPGLEPLFTADGRSDLDYPTVALNDQNIGLEFKATLLVPGSSSQYATEKTAAEAQTLRACEVRLTDSGGAMSLKLQFLAKHERGSLFTLGQQQGQNVVEVSLVGSTDATNYMAAVLVNATANDN